MKYQKNEKEIRMFTEAIFEMFKEEIYFDEF